MCPPQLIFVYEEKEMQFSFSYGFFFLVHADLKLHQTLSF